MALSNKEIRLEVIKGPSRWDLCMAIFDYEERRQDPIFFQHKRRPVIFMFKEFNLPDYPGFLFKGAEILINRVGHSPYDEVVSLGEYILKIDGVIQQLFWIDKGGLRPLLARFRGKKLDLPAPHVNGSYSTWTRSGSLIMSDKSWINEL